MKQAVLLLVAVAHLASVGPCNAAGTSTSMASEWQKEWLDTSVAAAAGRRALLSASGVKGAPVKTCSTISDCTPTTQPCMVNMCVDGGCKLTSKSDLSAEYGGCIDGDPLTSDKCNPSANHGGGCVTPPKYCQKLTFDADPSKVAPPPVTTYGGASSAAYAGLIFGARSLPVVTDKNPAVDSNAYTLWYDATVQSVPFKDFPNSFDNDCSDGSSPLCPNAAGLFTWVNVAHPTEPLYGQIRVSAQDGLTPWDLYSVDLLLFSSLAEYQANKGKPVTPDGGAAAVTYTAKAYNAAGTLITALTFNPSGGILEGTYMTWVLDLKGIITFTIDVLGYSAHDNGADYTKWGQLFLDTMLGCFPDPTMIYPRGPCQDGRKCLVY